MKKLTLVAMKRDVGRIMRKIMWLSCVEIEKHASKEDFSENPEKDRALSSIYESERQNAINDSKILEEAIRVLIKHGSVKGGIFSAPPTVCKSDFDKESICGETYGEVIEKAHFVVNKKAELERLSEEYNSCESKSVSLEPWLDYAAELLETETKKTEIMLGTLPKTVDNEKINSVAKKHDFDIVFEKISSDVNLSYVCLIYMKEDRERVKKGLSEIGFNRTELSDMSGTPSIEFTRLKKRMAEILSDTEQIKRELSEYSGEFDAFQIALDMSNTKKAMAEEKQKLTKTERCVVLSGFVPAEHVSATEKCLASENVYIEISDPEKDEPVPVHLVNTRPASYFESVVEMYSLPLYGSFDPTRIMTVFFFIIFGMMLGDFIYGLLITLGCLFITKKLNVSDGVKNMCRLFSVCGISCMIFGVLFGSYLGDLPAQLMMNMFGINIRVWSALDIMSQSIIFLVLSLAVGVLHMLTGMAIRFYVLWKHGARFSAIFDEGSWFIVFLGIGLYFINSLIGLITVISGVLMLVLTQGRNEKSIVMKAVKGVGSLYSVVNYMSDLLSYSRIMALGLSSAVVASVFNILATMGGFTVPGVIIFIIVLPVGHLLNLAINLLGTFVHTSRLQYVEFFGKFFEDGGRSFSPVRPDITHSVIKDSIGAADVNGD